MSKVVDHDVFINLEDVGDAMHRVTSTFWFFDVNFLELRLTHFYRLERLTIFIKFGAIKKLRVFYDNFGEIKLPYLVVTVITLSRKASKLGYSL